MNLHDMRALYPLGVGGGRRQLLPLATFLPSNGVEVGGGVVPGSTRTVIPGCHVMQGNNLAAF